MNEIELTKQKHLRILFFYRELSRHKIDYEECLKFMSYQFSVSINWITRIIKNHEENDFSDVKLEHIDLDVLVIDLFAKKLYTEAKKERNINNKEQLKLFS